MIKMKGKRKEKTPCAQSTIEFTFAMVATALLMIGMIRVYTWSARDLRMRRIAHEAVLTAPLTVFDASGPLEQIKPTFFTAANLEVTVNSEIF